MSKACARVIRALLACGPLSTSELSLKADVALETARRIGKELVSEGLVRLEKPSHEYVYVWKGVE